MMRAVLHTKPCAKRTLIAAAISAALVLGFGPAVHAQRAIRVGLISHPSVGAALRTTLVHALGERYTAVNLGTAAQPNPLHALASRVRAANVSLVVLARKQRSLIAVRFADPRNGEARGLIRLTVRRGKIATASINKLLAAVDEQITDLADDAGRSGSRASATRHPARAAEPRASAGDEDDAIAGAPADEQPDRDGSSESGSDLSDSSEDAVGDEPTPAADDERSVRLSLRAAIGTSDYRAEQRTLDGPVRLDGGTSFAVGIGAGLVFGRPATTRWALAARYATSIGRTVNELHRGGPPESMALRTHRFEAEFGPLVGLGTAGWTLSPTLGYALRSVVPEIHFQLIPFYTLGGPFVRAALASPLIASRVGLRITPELQWLPQASAVVGGTQLTAGRFAFGGEAAIVVRATDTLYVEVSWHESHAFGAASAPEIDDVQRFILAGVAVRP